MMLNISKLRRDYTSWPDSKSRLICQLLNIVEAAKRHSNSFIGASGVLTLCEEKSLEVHEAAEKLDELLEDVEVDDET